MGIVGFNFTKVSVEKMSTPQGGINIRNNVKMNDIGKADLNLGKAKQSGLRFTFNYTSDYEPSFGKLSIDGEVLVLEEEKKANEVLKAWKAKEEVDTEIMNNVMNGILEKCTVLALIVTREVGLPPSIPLPKVGQVGQQK
jgi:hypothetical protein